MILGDEIPKICASLTATTGDGILQQAKEAVQQGADLLEWRADLCGFGPGEESFWSILEELPEIGEGRPLLFTYRSIAQGGQGTIAGMAYAELLQTVAKTGKVDLLDVEMTALEDAEKQSTLITSLQEQGVSVIASLHLHRDDTGEADWERAETLLRESGGDLHKFACVFASEADVLTFLLWARKIARRREIPLVTVVMGPTGIVTRACGALIGSPLTFACIGEAAAEGQLSLRATRHLFEVWQRRNDSAFHTEPEEET